MLICIGVKATLSLQYYMYIVFFMLYLEIMEQQQQQEQEKQALLDLYNLCDGAEWYRIVNDTTTGRVIRLYFSGNNLTGDISKWTSIASLIQLRDLRLTHNNLTGDISKW